MLQRCLSWRDVWVFYSILLFFFFFSLVFPILCSGIMELENVNYCELMRWQFWTSHWFHGVSATLTGDGIPRSVTWQGWRCSVPIMNSIMEGLPPQLQFQDLIIAQTCGGHLPIYCDSALLLPWEPSRQPVTSESLSRIYRMVNPWSTFNSLRLFLMKHNFIGILLTVSSVR